MNKELLNPSQPDITELEQLQDFIQAYAQDVAKNYDEFLKECLEQCGLTPDYVSEHPEEFSKRENTQGDFCQYFRNGEEIFTIKRYREYQDWPGDAKFMSQCVFKYVATFPKHIE